METETNAAEREQMSEVNMFTLDPNGFKTHWKIVSGTTGDDLNKMMLHQGVLSKWLHEHQYKPDEMGRGNGHSAPVAASQAATGAPVGVAAAWVVNDDGSRSCSVHGVGEFVPPGVSTKTGKPYTGFWKCRVNGCKPAGKS